MKKLLNYVVLALLLFFTAGCSEDFLNPVRNNSLLTNEDFAENAELNPALIEGTLNGIYTYMITPFAVYNDQHRDFGHKSLDIWTDMLSGDMALAGNEYNWYGNFTNLVATSDYIWIENDIAWSYLYKIVNLSNGVVLNLGGNDAEPEGENTRAMLGQAKALRAYAYFYLTQLFQREYNPSQPILPLYKGDGELNFGKAPASEVYDFIISDLTHAVSLLDGFNPSGKHQINKSVAQGLLAYTYAAMGDYAQVKAVTDDIIATGGYPLTTAGQLAYPGAGSGFNDANTPSWMWGYDIPVGMIGQLVHWYGQVDFFSYSYAAVGDWKSMDNLLYNAIPANDIRKTQFATAGGPLQPVNKIFHAARVQMGQAALESDYVFMRIEEMYLLNAEAAAKTGDEATAKSRLKSLLDIRMGSTEADTYLNALSGQTLRDAIYLQTRIELWGEGKSYFAMKRNQATITRGTNHVFLPGISVPYNDARLSFKIPRREMNNNPAITEQN